MRITLLAIGTRGDVYPHIALGLGLQAAGHQVRIGTHTCYETLIRGLGLDFSEITVDPRTVLKTELGENLIDTGLNLVACMRQIARVVEPLAQQALVEMWNACQGTDAIMCTILGLAGYYIAAQLNVPVFVTCLQPLYRTRAHPSILIPFQIGLGPRFNYLTHILSEQIFWQLVRLIVNRWLESLEFSSASFRGPFRQLYKLETPVLCGYSSTIAPRPGDWGDQVAVTGYWFLDRTTDWQPLPDLVDFLASGPTPICVGFGSMSANSLEERITLTLKAVAQSGQRAILLTGWGGAHNGDLPDDIFVVEQVPHDWLFPQVTAVIHHGGAGTTAAALRAGVPSIVTPFFFDQFFWGRQVAKLGVGTLPIPRKSMSVKSLTTTIQSVLNDQPMRQRAAALGQRIRAEDGVAQAVKMFHRVMASR